MHLSRKTLPPHVLPGVCRHSIGPAQASKIAGRAIRFDALDQLARMAHLRASQGAFIATQEMFEAVGLEGTPFEQLMGALGYAAQQSEDGTTFRRKSRKRQKKGQRRRITTLTTDPNSPFALLRELANAK